MVPDHLAIHRVLDDRGGEGQDRPPIGRPVWVDGRRGVEIPDDGVGTDADPDR